ncbi:hypothetical protein DIPPA_34041 [Diplonema papillatum]|nr:hypothetical protein DIPPA_34041 [Diplonema papillatum]
MPDVIAAGAIGAGRAALVAACLAVSWQLLVRCAGGDYEEPAPPGAVLGSNGTDAEPAPRLHLATVTILQLSAYFALSAAAWAARLCCSFAGRSGDSGGAASNNFEDFARLGSWGSLGANFANFGSNFGNFGGKAEPGAGGASCAAWDDGAGDFASTASFFSPREDPLSTNDADSLASLSLRHSAARPWAAAVAENPGILSSRPSLVNSITESSVAHNSPLSHSYGHALQEPLWASSSHRFSLDPRPGADEYPRKSSFPASQQRTPDPRRPSVSSSHSHDGELSLSFTSGSQAKLFLSRLRFSHTHTLIGDKPEELGGSSASPETLPISTGRKRNLPPLPRTSCPSPSRLTPGNPSAHDAPAAFPIPRCGSTSSFISEEVSLSSPLRRSFSPSKCPSHAHDSPPLFPMSSPRTSSPFLFPPKPASDEAFSLPDLMSAASPLIGPRPAAKQPPLKGILKSRSRVHSPTSPRSHHSQRPFSPVGSGQCLVSQGTKLFEATSPRATARASPPSCASPLTASLGYSLPVRAHRTVSDGVINAFSLPQSSSRASPTGSGQCLVSQGTKLFEATSPRATARASPPSCASPLTASLGYSLPVRAHRTVSDGVINAFSLPQSSSRASPNPRANIPLVALLSRSPDLTRARPTTFLADSASRSSPPDNPLKPGQPRVAKSDASSNPDGLLDQLALGLPPRSTFLAKGKRNSLDSRSSVEDADGDPPPPRGRTTRFDLQPDAAGGADPAAPADDTSAQEGTAPPRPCADSKRATRFNLQPGCAAAAASLPTEADDDELADSGPCADSKRTPRFDLQPDCAASAPSPTPSSTTNSSPAADDAALGCLPQEADKVGLVQLAASQESTGSIPCADSKRTTRFDLQPDCAETADPSAENSNAQPDASAESPLDAVSSQDPSDPRPCQFPAESKRTTRFALQPAQPETASSLTIERSNSDLARAQDSAGGGPTFVQSDAGYVELVEAVSSQGNPTIRLLSTEMDTGRSPDSRRASSETDDSVLKDSTRQPPPKQHHSAPAALLLDPYASSECVSLRDSDLSRRVVKDDAELAVSPVAKRRGAWRLPCRGVCGWAAACQALLLFAFVYCVPKAMSADSLPRAVVLFAAARSLTLPFLAGRRRRVSLCAAALACSAAAYAAFAPGGDSDASEDPFGPRSTVLNRPSALEAAAAVLAGAGVECAHAFAFLSAPDESFCPPIVLQLAAAGVACALALSLEPSASSSSPLQASLGDCLACVASAVCLFAFVRLPFPSGPAYKPAKLAGDAAHCLVPIVFCLLSFAWLPRCVEPEAGESQVQVVLLFVAAFILSALHTVVNTFESSCVS